MKRKAKKTAIVLFASVFLLTQTACTELWYRYAAVASLLYITTMALHYYAAPFNQAMVSNTPPAAEPAEPGASTAHTMVLTPPGNTLLTRTILLTLSTAYAFHGFTALQGNPGEYRIVDPTGTLVLLAPILALSTTAAFIDLNNSGSHEAQWEPLIQWQAISATLQGFLITFPLWAGGPPGMAAYKLTDFAILTLFAGLLSNPLIAGTYRHNYTFTSIDPDSGGDNDNSGNSPVTRTLSHTVTIARQPRTLMPILDLILNQGTRR